MASASEACSFNEAWALGARTRQVVRERICGDRIEAVDAPRILERHRWVVRGSATRMREDFESGMRAGALGVDPIVEAVIEDIDGGVRLLDQDDPDLRIALMGRTMSGKSTLFEFLTHGDGNRIGAGGQRTTRETLERGIPGVPGCVLVDTPGVGAADGDGDRHVAFEAALECDVVLWVAANDSTQEETASALREVVKLGKPLIVFMNCRERIDSAARRARLIRNPEVLLRDIDGHWSRLHSFVNPQGVVPTALIWGHALAAFEAQRCGDTELLAASHTQDLLDALQRVVLARSAFWKAVSLSDAVRGPLAEAADSFMQGARDDERAADLGCRQAQEFHDRLRRLLNGQHLEGILSINALIDPKRTWYAAVDLTGDVARQWEAAVSTLQQSISRLFEQLDSELHMALREEFKAFVDDWTVTLPKDTTGVENPSMSTKANRLLKIVARVGPSAIAATIIAINMELWPIAGLLAALSPLVNKFVANEGGWIDRWLPGGRAKQEESRRDLRDNTCAELDQIRAHFAEQWARRIADYGEIVEHSVSEMIADADRHGSRARVRERRAQSCDRAIAELDLSLGKASVRLHGMPRAALAAVSVDRIPGVGMALEVAEPYYTDMSLLPSFEGEPLVVMPVGGRRPDWLRAADIVFGSGLPPYDVVDTRTFRVGGIRPEFAQVGVQLLATKVAGVPVTVQIGGDK